MTPREVSAKIEAASGEKFSSRRVLYWSRNRIAEFPALTKDLCSKFMKFDRVQIERWIEKSFGDGGNNAPRDDARKAKLVAK